MTLPNESAGLSELIALAFPVTNDGSIPGQQDNDQPTIEALLKQRMFDSAGWQGAHSAGFAGLPGNIPLVLGMLAKLAEQITGIPVTNWINQWLDNPIIAGLEDIVQDALAKIFTVNVNLQSIWESLNFLDEDFDPQNAWNIIAGFIPDWLEDLIFFNGAEGEGFPITFPKTFGSEPNIVTQFFYWLRKFTGIDDFDDLFSLNIVELIVNFIETLLKPQELLAWLVDGILPDIQAPQIVQDIILNIEAAFKRIPLVGNLLVPVFDAINGLLGIGTGAQGSANNANNDITAIWAAINSNAVPGGVQFVDDFGRAEATNLGADYEQVYAGPGGGYMGTDGEGNAVWTAVGSEVRFMLARCLTPLATRYQQVSVVMPDYLPEKTPDSPTFNLLLRMNAAKTQYVKCNIIGIGGFLGGIAGFNYNARVRLSVVVNGVETVLGTTVDTPTKDGDRWELWAGTTADEREFVVRKNGTFLMSRTDTADLSPVNDTTHLYAGYGGTAGRVVTAFIFFDQVPLNTISIFAAADRAP